MGTMTLIAIGAGIIVVIVAVVAIFSVRQEKDILEERLTSNYAAGANLELDGDYVEETEQETSIRQQALDALDNALSERQWAQNWRIQLARADLKLTVAEFAALHVVTLTLGFILSYFIIFRGNIVFAILGGFLGLFAPRIYVARQVSTRLVRFENQLPDTLSLWVNALRSGYSVMQSMDAISRDAPEPTSTEFKRVVQEAQLGISMEDALDHLLARVESDDLDLVITAVNIQREVGGNLAEILEVIAHTIRERIKIKGEIRVLTSQGRYTGYLISFMPIGLGIFLNVVQPGYMGQMFTNRTCGWPMIGIGLALIGIGQAIIQKIVDIEI